MKGKRNDKELTMAMKMNNLEGIINKYIYITKTVLFVFIV